MPDEEVDRSTKVPGLITRRKVALMEAGVSGLQIAEQLGITKQAVSRVINGHANSERVQRAIAAACGVAVEELFPSDAPAAKPSELDGQASAA